MMFTEVEPQIEYMHGDSTLNRGTIRRGVANKSLGGNSAQLCKDLINIRANGRADIMHSIASLLERVDSRTLSSVLRELCKRHDTEHRARDVFDFLRSLPQEDARSSLLDVYTYTVMISGCSGAGCTDGIKRATALFREMKGRQCDPNVHTHTALMNVYIKCGEPQLAIQQFKEMQRLGVLPNVVTYNTLIDVYGKLGRWEDCLNVLSDMKQRGVEPVVRTYNTVMIACNAAGRTAETLQVYSAMLSNSLRPNTTSFNALISAYSKAHRFDMVWDTYRTMIQQACERTVITFSCLISACEKSGQWQLALQVFDEMLAEGCKPNVVTFNSLITACSESGQWQQALHIFDLMRTQGCDPDVITYTSVIGAHSGPGHWADALASFYQMRGEGVEVDDVVCDVLVEALWDSGVESAVRRAVAEHRTLLRRGVLRMLIDKSQPETWELNLNGITFGTVVATLLVTLADLWSIHTEITANSGPGMHLEDGGNGGGARGPRPQLPQSISVCMGKLKAKGADSAVLRTAFLALLSTLGIPHKPSLDQKQQALMHLPTSEVLMFLERQQAEYLRAQAAGPATASAPLAWPEGAAGDGSNGSGQNGNGNGNGNGSGNNNNNGEHLRPFIHLVFELDRVPAFSLSLPEVERDRQSERQAVQELQETYALERAIRVEPRALEDYFSAGSSDGPGAGRRALVAGLTQACGQMGLDVAAVHDALLVADRLITAGVPVGPSGEGLASAVALALRWNHAEDLLAQKVGAAKAEALLLEQGVDYEKLASAAGCGAGPQVVQSLRNSVRNAVFGLGGPSQTFSPSAYRVLSDMLLPRLELRGQPSRAFGRSSPSNPQLLLSDLATHVEFARYRPGVLAAAALSYARISSGVFPFLPRALCMATGMDMSDQDLVACVSAIKEHCTRQAVAAGLVPSAALIQLGQLNGAGAHGHHGRNGGHRGHNSNGHHNSHGNHGGHGGMHHDLEHQGGSHHVPTHSHGSTHGYNNPRHSDHSHGAAAAAAGHHGLPGPNGNNSGGGVAVSGMGFPQGAAGYGGYAAMGVPSPMPMAAVSMGLVPAQMGGLPGQNAPGVMSSGGIKVLVPAYYPAGYGPAPVAMHPGSYAPSDGSGTLNSQGAHSRHSYSSRQGSGGAASGQMFDQGPASAPSSVPVHHIARHDAFSAGYRDDYSSGSVGEYGNAGGDYSGRAAHAQAHASYGPGPHHANMHGTPMLAVPHMAMHGVAIAHPSLLHAPYQIHPGMQHQGGGGGGGGHGGQQGGYNSNGPKGNGNGGQHYSRGNGNQGNHGGSNGSYSSGSGSSSYSPNQSLDSGSMGGGGAAGAYHGLPSNPRTSNPSNLGISGGGGGGAAQGGARHPEADRLAAHFSNAVRVSR